MAFGTSLLMVGLIAFAFVAGIIYGRFEERTEIGGENWLSCPKCGASGYIDDFCERHSL